MELIKTFMKRQKANMELRKAFKNAGIFLKYKNGDKELKIFPRIHQVNFDKKAKTTFYIFTLVNGMDPKEVMKKDYVFKQHFGKNIDLKGDSKTFKLTIYQTSMPKLLPYKFNEIKAILAPYRLGIICGVDRNGQYVGFDLLKQPHILIAGETGSGKSTQLRSILTTLIKMKRPEDLQLYLGDCKKSEFHIFRKVEHVKCVLSNPVEIRSMLKHIKKELDERSDLTEAFEVSHIDHIPAQFKRPYIIVCIDEFVMLRKDETVMDILTEIVAIGRTLGVFAVLSMQRPNAQVLDTTIRANLTVSMGFKLRDKIESRIVNTPGADEIEVDGRFIMNNDRLYEIQAPLLEMEDAKELLSPFMVAKEAKKVEEPADIAPDLTEKDVFLDVTDET
ncbi:FtsK/SpoIIIE domain-containing protein [Heyndrickxia acidicola]|uniref:FtsK/SpoIIIE domain-containing protein n=1 Tax=Heyndrickxia acidicola TaxID=209389 RepID=A0ABU6MNH1_9BACI|nr:FtsK/SpoIIIE domain-containing protein [Heyndrickxia acidicola]MED1205874.1 FtsK/SpoIIIE domain-containing protein [Heyndrickxia acidicola]